ncbi:MAG: hypothetical protein K9K66_01495 [Desulfarculaceae bacterium]|nr:hypothetical protein [Desulfarculaceae bacterium]MCF8072388.1 hypothetical protein [Desulfarculaceae bacterium]MCF8100309.1 hypothetical protein [Desulfarculaceae bacterium]MCF8116118.1 hypothetical protein [Desulfarculaceae bacterium]
MKRLTCHCCGRALEPGLSYRHQGQDLCEACCLDLRQTRPRKTHWQYLTAIKSQYLQEAPSGRDDPKK